MPKTRTAPRMRRSWRTPDALWAEIAPSPPPGKPHPLGCHNPRVDDRRAMDAIFFRLRTGCRWNALSTTGLCSSPPRTAASRSGPPRACSMSCGAVG